MPAVSGSPTQEATTQPTVAALESVEVSQMTDGDWALVQAGDIYYVLDVESIAPVDHIGNTVLYTRNSNPIYSPTATALTPGRWVLLTTALGCTCPTGPTGPGGGVGASAFGNFFEMAGQLPATVLGAAMTFSQNGPANGIVRTSATQFSIPVAGVYEVIWQASITEAGQMVVGLDLVNGATEVARTVVGRAPGTNQIVGDVLLTVAANSILTLRNPAGSATALTRTANAGSGAVSPVSSTLTIKRVA